MALFHLFVGILILVNFTDAEGGKDGKCKECTAECTTEDQTMFFSAGFITASLMFSLGCFVTKCKTKSRNKNMDQDCTEQTHQHAIENLPNAISATHVYANDGVSDSYANINTEARNTDEQSTSSRTRLPVTESYDTVEHNRVGSLLNTTVDNNPYNRSIQHMDNAEYDVACVFKSSLKSDDPTYSHALPAEVTYPIIKDQGYESFRLPATPSAASNSSRQNKTTKSKMSVKWNSNSKTTIPNAQTTKKGVKIHIKERSTGKCDTDHTGQAETVLLDTLYENSIDLRPVGRENAIREDNEDDNTSFDLQFGEDDDSSQFVTSGGESNSSSSQMSSSLDKSDEESCLLSSMGDVSSDQTGSEFDNGSGSITFPPVVAVNVLYEELYDVTKNNCVFGTQNDLSKRLEKEINDAEQNK